MLKEYRRWGREIYNRLQIEKEAEELLQSQTPKIDIMEGGKHLYRIFNKKKIVYSDYDKPDERRLDPDLRGKPIAISKSEAIRAIKDGIKTRPHLKKELKKALEFLTSD